LQLVENGFDDFLIQQHARGFTKAVELISEPFMSGVDLSVANDPKFTQEVLEIRRNYRNKTAHEVSASLDALPSYYLSKTCLSGGLTDIFTWHYASVRKTLSSVVRQTSQRDYEWHLQRWETAGPTRTPSVASSFTTSGWETSKKEKKLKQLATKILPGKKSFALH
jgi:hypothetical protein